MAMYQAISIFLLSLTVTVVAAVFVQPLKSSLAKPSAWLALSAAAGASSAVSALIASTRHAGTGFTVSHGWPKPFYFRYLDETGRQSDGFSFLYFLGNALIFMAVGLALWTLWRLSRR